MVYAVLAAFIVVGAVLSVATLYTQRRTSTRLPPGPKGLPIIGNVLDLPPADTRLWEFWLKHKALYGPISYISVLKESMVILNNYATANELLEKQSSISHDRVQQVFFSKMCGWGQLLGFLPPGRRWRVGRTQFHATVGTPQNVARFIPIQNSETHRFLARVLADPGKLFQHVRAEAAAITLRMTYGYTIDFERPDPLTTVVDEAFRQAGHAGQPGAWLVDLVPALRYLPDWCPGASFKQTAKHYYSTLHEVIYRPAAFVKQQMATNSHERSFLSTVYEQADGSMSAEDESIAVWTAGALYAGAADTACTVSTLYTFFVLMAIYPDIQQRAQSKIDEIVGNGRLPSISDRHNLPFVEALIKETLRWHPVAPTGIPHLTTADATCAGYDIPKGANVIPNLWAIGRDPDVYANPNVFSPGRFLGQSPELDPRSLVFGFGRRICPGKLMADQTLFLTLSRALAVFNIRKELGQDRKVIEPVLEFDPGLVSQPKAVKLDIKARSIQHEALIREVEVLHPWQRSNAEELRKITSW